MTTKTTTGKVENKNRRHVNPIKNGENSLPSNRNIIEKAQKKIIIQLMYAETKLSKEERNRRIFPLSLAGRKMN
ncbi:hypothetical protein AA23498_0061 [Acetobacter nitrogenifigens DSM 23921 = NBRC 105050]|uniref:Uncharacterized protein n=1 Tax=Acetobacter nitrogenifigens DSM 23921 = NBRC 105050 TaxID=1120919 RepID=A0A511X8Z7_9PROT|nr:hypothetical protein AA23498_0061 [Acetobacter nitrogenifigens DSM 23921 = NBRC 105050]GEN59425.1 hypothetical protein ANI02nite_13090 [Acetobacter nitrogenifigens DSM 23921 = NBRC 105050]